MEKDLLLERGTIKHEEFEPITRSSSDGGTMEPKAQISEEDTSLHAVWSCKCLRGIRKSWQLNEKIGNGKGKHFLDFMLECFRLLKSVKMALFCVVLWRVWNHRNLIVRGKPMWSPEDIFEWASCFIEEYQNCATSHVVSNVSGSQLTAPCWVPPLLGRFLTNSDAAIDSSSRVMGIGVVI
ncbi:hypothetical protein QYF36_005071 [Acer negundo]|nr:hypothetical protein QYF36_005071 [Acer negundo]